MCVRIRNLRLLSRDFLDATEDSCCAGVIIDQEYAHSRCFESRSISIVGANEMSEVSSSAVNSKNSSCATVRIPETSKFDGNLSRTIYIGELGVVESQTTDRMGDIDIICLSLAKDDWGGRIVELLEY